MSLTSKKTDDLMATGADRLLGRATNRRELTTPILTERLRSVAEKYIFKHDPGADPDTITAFLDGLHADELCLVMACEQGDQ
ncbi:MAG TPA: hypothetical protein VFU37_20480, partial [Pyrinomonadaceae bacterium]|nr:hypothetical protein [Pyrinomonadaceae bacterium]